MTAPMQPPPLTQQDVSALQEGAAELSHRATGLQEGSIVGAMFDNMADEMESLADRILENRDGVLERRVSNTVPPSRSNAS
jgi:hypothetical protein